MKGAFVLTAALVLSASVIACDPSARAIAQPPVTSDAPSSLEALSPPSTPPEPSTPARGPLFGRRICLDPGHDGVWAPGATGHTRSGAVPLHPTNHVPLYEHDLTLSVAERLQPLLEAEGASVCLTRKSREAGGGGQSEPYDYNGDGRVRSFAVEDTPERTQPRIDWANGFGAELLVSIHFNGLDDPRARGTEVYYTDAGPTAEAGRRLAGSMMTGLLTELRAAGHAVQDRGLRSDAYQRYSPAELRRMIESHAAVIRANGQDPARCNDCYRLFTLGNNPMSLHPATYLGVMVEVEFLSNPDVVEGLILRLDLFDVIARGLLHGIEAYSAVE